MILCGPGIGFDFVPRSPLNSVQMPAKAVSGLLSLLICRRRNVNAFWALRR